MSEERQWAEAHKIEKPRRLVPDDRAEAIKDILADRRHRRFGPPQMKEMK